MHRLAIVIAKNAHANSRIVHGIGQQRGARAVHANYNKRVADVVSNHFLCAMANQAPKKLVFLHIPKTAGTTLTSIIERNYSAPNRVALYNAEHFQADLKSALANPEINMLYGHFVFNDILNDANFYLFTFLREPIACTVSNYIHLKNSPDPEHKEWMKSVKSFEDFLNLKLIFNWQTRHLSGQKYFADFVQDQNASLEMATKNLLRMNFVGITERFKESLLCLSSDLDWKKLRHKNQNVQQKNDEAQLLASKYREQILEKNQLDIALYKLANTLLENQIEKITLIEKAAFKLKLLF